MQGESPQNKEKLGAFAHRLGVLAGRKRLKQVEIARRLAVSPQRVGSWFQGRNFPGGDVEHALAALLGVDRAWLIDGTENTETTAGQVNEGPTEFGEMGDLQASIRAHMEALLLAAGSDVTRLGWISQQLQAHLAMPSHWRRRSLVAEIQPKKEILEQRLPSSSQEPRTA